MKFFLMNSKDSRVAEKGGTGFEYIPSKLVFTRIPGAGGGKKKMRWVVCGNLEPKEAEEETFSWS